MKTFILLLIPFATFAQQHIEQELDTAFINAKKGIYWVLSNLDPAKSRQDKELIADNKLYCTVKSRKEVEGIKIESRGYCSSTEVYLKIYRSDDYLEREGYLKRGSPADKRKPGEK